MDFNDTKDEAAFRAEARGFLKQHLKLKGEEAAAAKRLSHTEFLAVAKDWQAKKAANGYAQITWPKEIGGRGGTPMQQVIWNQEESKFDAPVGPMAPSGWACACRRSSRLVQANTRRAMSNRR